MCLKQMEQRQMNMGYEEKDNYVSDYESSYRTW